MAMFLVLKSSVLWTILVFSTGYVRSLLHVKALADFLAHKITASRESHPALRNKFHKNYTAIFLKNKITL